jgi:hypothetical protein
MSAKTPIFGDIDKIDDSIEWDNIESIFKHKNRRKIEAVDELRERLEAISENLDSMPLNERFVIGPIVDGPGAYEYEAANHILKNLFKNLERAKFLKNLSFSVIDEAIDGGHPELILEASFSFNKKVLLQGLSFVRERLVKEISATNQLNEDFAFKFPHKLRRGTRWENITIEFLSTERVCIRAGKYKYDTDFREMGFENSKTGKPNTKWNFMQALAAKNGSIVWDEGGDLKYKKLVQLLSEDLSNYFSIDFPPFEPYSSKKGYTLKATIYAPDGFFDDRKPSLNEDEDWVQGIDTEDNF